MDSKVSQMGPWRLTFDTNPDLCNLNCVMCEEHSIYTKHNKKKNRLMDFQIIKKVVREAKEYGLREIIPSTMGEPLLYPYMEDLIRLTKENYLKLNITTNGTFPGLGVEKWAKLILPIVSDIKISINGATKEIAENIMIGMNFKKFLNDIDILIKMRDIIIKNQINYPSITFQITFMEQNLKELINIIKLAINHNIDRVKGHHLWITHPELQKESLRRNNDSINRWNKHVEKIIEYVKNNPLENGKQIFLENFLELSLKKRSKDWACPFLGKEGWIAFDGTFNVCCAPDNLRRTLGEFGNVLEHNIIDLWNSEIYQSLVKNWNKYQVCQICNMKKPKNKFKR
ncbi:MAG: radical SAM protein [Candidatus Lokiarchaeota archaeon]|nr:radical SAM protein [Candidatus Lokiarchaeota archaeon]